jgi:acylphosphatase
MKSGFEIIVKGRVQGVGFRYFVHKRALEHEITGFVRNMPGPSVYVLAEGEDASLGAFVDHIKMGPPLARVIDVIISRTPYSGSYSSFDIRF